MSWKISRLSTSLMGLLRESDADAEEEVERIRDSMVDSVDHCMDDSGEQRAVWRKLTNAPDIQTLWYLRSDVMHLLCHHCGETEAQAKLQELTELFRGRIPTAQFASAKRRS